MPGFNGTGPNGFGPMTGKGEGFCVLKKRKDNTTEIKGIFGVKNSPFKQNKKEVKNMPGGDGTGPAGMGPMTGRAAGFCAGYAVPGYANPMFGRGIGFGRGGGRGRRNWFYATGLTGWQRANYGVPFWGGVDAPTPFAHPNNLTNEQEMESLKNQAKYLEDTLAEITKRIQELEAKQQS